MKTALKDPQTNPLSEEKTSETKQYITFSLSNYLFALPSEDILKIVATPPPGQGGMVSMGLVQLEQYSIQILDLAKLLGLQAEIKPGTETINQVADSEAIPEGDVAENPPFLMVLQNEVGELWGIAVEEPPDLMDVPDYALKAVPEEKRLTRTLRWVSHVVTYDLADKRHTLLILDISVLLAPKPAEVDANDMGFLSIEPPLEPVSSPSESINARQEEMYA